MSPSANTSPGRAPAPQRASFRPPTEYPELLGQQAQADSLLGQARWLRGRVLTPTAEQVLRVQEPGPNLGPRREGQSTGLGQRACG